MANWHFPPVQNILLSSLTWCGKVFFYQMENIQFVYENKILRHQKHLENLPCEHIPKNILWFGSGFIKTKEGKTVDIGKCIVATREKKWILVKQSSPGHLMKSCGLHSPKPDNKKNLLFLSTSQQVSLNKSKFSMGKN